MTDQVQGRVKKAMLEVPGTGQVGTDSAVFMAGSMDKFLRDVLESAVGELEKDGEDGDKKLSVANIRTVVETTERFDFLRNVVVPEKPKVYHRRAPKKQKASSEHGKDNDQQDGDSPAPKPDLFDTGDYFLPQLDAAKPGGAEKDADDDDGDDDFD